MRLIKILTTLLLTSILLSACSSEAERRAAELELKNKQWEQAYEDYKICELENNLDLTKCKKEHDYFEKVAKEAKELNRQN